MRVGVLVALVAVTLALAAPAHAEALPGVLSATDVHTYRAIFDAQRHGKIAKAETLSSQLADRSLMGYVLAHRYLKAPGHRTKFAELKDWLAIYAELPTAEPIYKFALKRRPNRRSAVPAPISVRWRPPAEDAAEVMQTELGARAQAQIRAFVRDGSPDAANAVLKNLGAGGGAMQPDIDRLNAYVAQSYLGEGRDAEALALAESVSKPGVHAPLADWTAGIAAYRLSDFTRAAKHFDAVTEANGLPYYVQSGAAFWAARSYQRAGEPARVIGLYAKAASEPFSFYGAMATRLLGRELGLSLKEPEIDAKGLAALMTNKAAHRALALNQIGQKEYIEGELLRAYSDLETDQVVAFAFIARHFGDTPLALKASLMAARQGIYLTTLYPIPAYAPKDGYQLDTALMLAFARQESGFDGDAVSRSGARGVMQVMPKTAAHITKNKKLAGKQKKKLDDPAYNMSLGQKYLRDLLTRQNGNLFQLAAAYNAGPGNLSRWLSEHQGNDDPLLFIESIPLRETRWYIKQVMLNLWMYTRKFGRGDATLDDAAAGQWPLYAPGKGAGVH